MDIVSVNVGQPVEVVWRERRVRTSIFKSPQAGASRVGFDNVQGDAQADLRVHGGRDKAVYVFAAENYEHWRARYPQHQLTWGFFGENLTTRGLCDADVHVGDRYRFGSAELQVTLPRLPCSRLALRFQDETILEAFLERLQTGYYCRVLAEGVVQAGDSVQVIACNTEGLTIPDLAALYSGRRSDPDLLQRAAADSALPETWRQRFRTKSLQRREGS